MHSRAFMAHIGFADKKNEGKMKMKRILRANNFDVGIQMRSCEVLWREMSAALRSAPIPWAQINIKGEPAPRA